jgi:hypothetical protein
MFGTPLRSFSALTSSSASAKKTFECRRGRKVEHGPIAGGFGQVVGMAAIGIGWARRQALVDADVVKAWPLVLEPFVVLLVGCATTGSSCRHCCIRLAGSSSTLAEFEML